MIKATDIHWVAGFLEGEGWFGFNRSVKILFPQKDPWPVEKFHELFGGCVYNRPAYASSKPQQIWSASGKTAAAICMMVYPFMSPRRQETIRKALQRWKAQGTRADHLRRLHRERQATLTHCPHGHEYTPDNIKWQGPNKKNKSCRTCHRQRQTVYNRGRGKELYHLRKRLNA